MVNIIEFIKDHSNVVEPVACCCGHGKYPMTIVLKTKSVTGDEIIFDMISDETIPRKKRFYVKDKKGYYYIPEVLENEK